MSSIFGNTVGNRISYVNSSNRECFYIQHSVVYIQIFLAQFNHSKKEERRKEKERKLTVKPRRAPPVYNWELLQLSKGTDVIGSGLRSRHFVKKNKTQTGKASQFILPSTLCFISDSLSHRASVRQALAKDETWVKSYFSKLLPLLQRQENSLLRLFPGVKLNDPPYPGNEQRLENTNKMICPPSESVFTVA